MSDLTRIFVRIVRMIVGYAELTFTGKCIIIKMLVLNKTIMKSKSVGVGKPSVLIERGVVDRTKRRYVLRFTFCIPLHKANRRIAPKNAPFCHMGGEEVFL